MPERVGDLTGESPTNLAVDRDKASRMANLLEGLGFPATKEQITRHVDIKSPSTRSRTSDILQNIEDNLEDGREYASAYDIEVALGLVQQTGRQKPYVRDRALNRANSRRTGEEIRPDPYSGRESIKPASSKDVSPNTPPGEDI
jgi:hypothetical protein